MIKRIRLAGVWVSDQEAAYDFYVNKVGFEVQADMTMGDGYRWLEVKPAGSDTALAVVKPYPGQEAVIGQFANVVFATDDIAETHAALAAKGVNFIEPPTRQIWGGMQAQFADPDGNLFVLVERED